MPDVLSQKQIDELLDSLSAGKDDFKQEATAENSVKKYDFKSPQKLSKEHLKTLMSIYETFSRHLASYFSGILRVACEISVSSIEELPYYEYNNSLPDSVMIGVMDAKPIEGEILIDISNVIAFTLIDRLLGGNGEDEIPNRDYTEIEVSLMQRIFHQIARYTKDSWSAMISMETEIKQIETNARLIQTIAMDEVVVIIVMDVAIGSVKGTLDFCVPCINLESIIDQFNQNRYHSKRVLDEKQEQDVKDVMLSHVGDSLLEMKGIWGKTTLSLRDVLSLQIGDVISFDRTVDKNVSLAISDRTWFYGTPGVRKGQKAVKISKVL